MSVVFHVNETEKWSMALGNVHNLLKVSSKEVGQIEIVANGEAVTGYLKANLGIKFHELTEQGVQLSACQNALKAHDIKNEELPPFITIVPAGVLRLIECQNNGYAYIKP